MRRHPFTFTSRSIVAHVQHELNYFVSTVCTSSPLHSDDFEFAYKNVLRLVDPRARRCPRFSSL
jgi:hypothetical protein